MTTYQVRTHVDIKPFCIVMLSLVQLLLPCV